MTDARGLYDALETQLRAQINAARYGESKDQGTLALQDLKKDVEGFFDQAILEIPGKSGVQSILSDSKKRVCDIVDGKNELEGAIDNVLDGPAQEVLNDLRSALGWVVPRPVDPDIVASVIARDRASALKAGHPVGPMKKVL